MNSNPIIPWSATEQEDRLSTLPYPILCRILSFMPTKYAARTSILSINWRYIYLCVPNIDLEELSMDMLPEKRQDFINFVNRRLMLSGSSLVNEFRLRYFWDLQESCAVNLWLTALLFRSIKSLKIEVLSKQGGTAVSPPPLCPPRGISASKTIVVLKLCGHIVFKVPESVRLPNLKVLHLTSVGMQFESGRFRFGEGFPLLEDLRLDRIVVSRNKGDIPVMGIYIPTLRRFALVIMGDELNWIDIDTPLLQYLECTCLKLYRKPTVQINLIRKCEALVSAKFSVMFEPIFDFQGGWFTKLLQKVHKIKELHLSVNILMGLVRCGGSWPTFPHLIRLEMSAHKELLWIVLQCSPQLESLDFNMPYGRLSEPPEIEPHCLTQNLKNIRLRNVEGTEGELAVIRYFLQHGVVLERMIVQLAKNRTTELLVKIMRQLLWLERQSPKCRIELT